MLADISVVSRIKGRPKRIAHVEVGGSLGGSVVCLDVYLRHCDTKYFQHEALFYRRPPEARLQMEDHCRVLDLGLPVPTGLTGPGSPARQRVRRFIARHPWFGRRIADVRSFYRVLRRLPDAVKLALLFRRQHYDLIHCNNNFNYQPVTLMAAWLSRKPVVAHFRTPVALSLCDRWLARIPVSLIAISDSGARYLRDQGIRAPSVVCRDPLEHPRFSTANASGLRQELLAGGKSLIGVISRLDENKGLEDLVAAARELRNRMPDARYVIVGRGPRLGILKQLASQWELTDRVQFLGFQPHAFDYSACFDVFVNPSHNEGGPLTVLEAMLMGIPVVSTRVGMVPDWITDGEHGLIVDPGDPAGLANAIEQVLSKPVEAHAMAARGEARARKLCDPAACARELDGALSAAFSTRTEGASCLGRR